MKLLRGERAIWLARGSALMHALEPAMFGLSLAGGIYLATHQAGALVVLDRLGVAQRGMLAPGLLLVLGVTLVAASLIFFHRKGRALRDRLAAAAVALVFFGAGYAREVASAREGTFFGMATLARPASRDPAPSVADRADRRDLRLNAHGLRGADFSVERPSAAARVAVVGASLVVGPAVAEDDTLPARLAAHLRARSGARRLEVINLGVPDNHLASHLAMADVAERNLGADVVVLCLRLPDDLSAWDAEAERRDHARASGFSFVSYLFGHATARALWRERNVAREVTPARVAFLESEVARLSALRMPGSSPLVVLLVGAADAQIADAWRAVPGAVVVKPAAGVVARDAASRDLGPAENDALASHVAAAFDPAWLAAAR